MENAEKVLKEGFQEIRTDSHRGLPSPPSPLPPAGEGSDAGQSFLDHGGRGGRREKALANPGKASGSLATRQRGFTLVEAVMVIVIAGIVAAAVAVFIRHPIEAYVDIARRAALTDTADTAARRIARDLSGALPNSVRVDVTGLFLEFVPIVAGGLYRAEGGLAGTDDPLLFDGADMSFDVLGPPLSLTASPDLSLVVYNQGIAGADVYENPSTVRRGLASVSGNTLSFSGGGLTVPSPGHRFQIAGKPVSYVCDLATGMLWRYAGYAFQNPQPASLSALGGSGAARSLLASRLAGCKFAYTGALQGNGLVSILLSFSGDGETVTLQQQVNVDNVP
jgi:MSHA biogenesis protein MshO